MDEGGEDVKAKRSYDASGRRDRARQSRGRILVAAEELFKTEGYLRTTIAEIAHRAEVSVDTIYKTYGGKPGLVRAIVEVALLGEGPVPAEKRSDALQAEEPDPRRIIEGWARFVTEISPRGSPVIMLARAAASANAELGELLDELDNSRLRRMTLNAQRFSDAGHLRPGMTVAEAADVMWTYSSAELYELLVLRRGMSLPRYGSFVAEAMIAALL